MMLAPRPPRSAAALGAAAKRRPGYVLIVVLLVIVVLSLAAYRFAEAMTSEYAVAVRSTEAAQAKAFAVSGVYYAAGALADPDTLAGTLGGNPTDAPALGNVTVGPDGGPHGGGRFSLFTVGDTFTGSGEGRYVARYGVTDEGAKLNVNALIQLDPTGQVLHDALMLLPNMTEDVADAIVDWLDADDDPRTNGAESSFYGGASPVPYTAKNGPANTLDELLLVRGVTPQLLFGNDRNRNGRMDPAEADGNDFNRGWSEYLTVYGRELDVDAAGTPRVVLGDTTADAATLSADLTAAVGQDMSDYILFYMLGGTATTSAAASTTTATTTGTGTAAAAGTTASTGAATTAGSTSGTGGSASTSSTSSSGSSGSTSAGGSGSSGGSSSGSSTSSGTAGATGTMADLSAAVQQKIAAGTALSKPVTSVLMFVNSTATVPKQTAGTNGQMTTTNVSVASPLNDTTTLNTLLPTLLEKTTPRTGFEITPRVNVNTAPPEVLTALPALTADDVTAITAARGTLAADDPATLTGAWLATAANVKPNVLQALEPYVTGRSMTYRAQSVGYFAAGGPAARVEAVIDTNQGNPRIVYFRDLTDLGRGFELQR